MENFYINLNQIKSNPDGQPTVNRQSRLMSYRGNLKNLAMLFAVLMLSIANIATAWGTAPITDGTSATAGASGTVTFEDWTSLSTGKCYWKDGIKCFQYSSRGLNADAVLNFTSKVDFGYMSPTAGSGWGSYNMSGLVTYACFALGVSITTPSVVEVVVDNNQSNDLTLARLFIKKDDVSYGTDYESGNYTSGTDIKSRATITRVTDNTGRYKISIPVSASDLATTSPYIIKFYSNSWTNPIGFVFESVTVTPAGGGCSAYEFHYGTNGQDNWETECFERVGETEEWRIENFTIPSTSHYYVGYHGDGTNGWNPDWSSERAWTDWPTKSHNKWQGQIFLAPNDGALGSFAVGQATGAVGTLTIHSNYNDLNKYLSFTPNGYGITYGGTGHAFVETATSNMYETDVVTLPDVSTTYNIGLATATEGTYVKSIHSKATDEAISAMGVTEIDGGKKKIYLNAGVWRTNAEGRPDDVNEKMAVWDATNVSGEWGNGGNFLTYNKATGLYEGYVSSSTTKIVLTRINNGRASLGNTWGDGVYNQTYDITLTATNNEFTITAWHDNNDNKKPSTHTAAPHSHPATGDNGKFRMWANSADQNWYVHWVPYYKLSYDGNGGTGSVAAQYRNSELSTSPLTVAGNGFTREGWTFTGWNTEKHGKGMAYAAGDDIDVTEDITLYAQWERTVYLKSDLSWWYNKNGDDDAWFSIYYWDSSADSNKGWVEMELADCETNVYKATLPGNGFNNVIFVRKTTDHDLDWDNVNNQSVNISYPTTNPKYTITSQISGGDDNGKVTGSWGSYSTPTFTISYTGGTASESGSKSEETKTCNVDFTLPGVVFSRTGYTQTGWTTSDGGAQTHALGGSYTDNTAQTFYPVWSQIMVTGITLDPTSKTLVIDETQTITPTVLPATALDKTVTWMTSDDAVATVDNGVVTAVGTGTATITATANDGSGVYAECAITVSKKTPTKYDFSADETSICSGGNVTFTLANSQEGATYYVTKNSKGGDAIGDSQDGDGSALEFTVSSASADDYYCFTTETDEFDAGKVSKSKVTISYKTATSITTNPTNVTDAVVGEEASLTVVAAGSGLSYQWKESSTEDGTYSNVASGGTSATYAVTPAAAGTKWYKCEITGDCGNATTAARKIVAIELYTVTYDAGSGSCATPSAKQASEGASLTLPTATRSGYTFDGWEDKDENLIGVAGASYTPTGNIILYAKWTALSSIPCLDMTELDEDEYWEGDKTYGDAVYEFTEVGDTKEGLGWELGEPASDDEANYIHIGALGIIKEVKLTIEEVGASNEDESTSDKGISYYFGEEGEVHFATDEYKKKDNLTAGTLSLPPTSGDFNAFVFKPMGTTLKISEICIYYTDYPVYTVSYNAMGGTCSPTTENTTTVLGKVTLPSATNSTYDLVWVESDGTPAGEAGDKYKPEGDVTLYAKWIGDCDSGGASVTFTSSNKNDAGENFATMSTATSNTSQMVGNGAAKLIAIGTDDAELMNDVSKKKVGYRYDSRCDFVFKFDDTSTLDLYLTNDGKTKRACGLYSFISEKALSAITASDYSSKTIVSTNVTAKGAEVASVGASSTNPSISDGVVKPGKSGGMKISYTSLAAGYYVFHSDSTATMCLYSFEISSPCYTVTYDGNGATSGYVNDPRQYTSGANPEVLDCGYTRTGYAFIGWCTMAVDDGTGTWYQPGDVIEDIDDDVTLYAIWKQIKYFTGAASTTSWNTDGNWSPSGVPAITDPVVIRANTEVDIVDAKALRVDIQSGNTLTINAGKALIIAETLTKAGGATAATDVIINSTRAAGTGALIIGGEAGTNQATVNFETKVKRESGTGNWINQYVGSPFSDNTPYVDYALQLYKFCPKANGDRTWWATVHEGDAMTPFWGYDVLYNDNNYLDVTWTGTLNASTTKTINGTDLYYNGSSATDNMFANSWTAPIHVGEIEDSDVSGIEKTFYLFNAGTPQQDNNSNINDRNTDAGTYVSMPIHSAEYAGIGVIPAMQAFYVVATGASPSLTLDYEKVVYTPALTAVGIQPNRAPRRTRAEAAPEVIKLHVQSETGWAANTYVMGREDFAEGYEDGWDGAYIEGESQTPKLYTPSIDGNMFINCLPQIEGTVVSFRKGLDDSAYTFSFKYDGEEEYYLNDLKEQTSTLINNENTYMFSAEAEDATARFIISATPVQKVTTGVDPASGEQSAKVRKVIINDHIYIIRGGRMYSAEGALVK